MLQRGNTPLTLGETMRAGFIGMLIGGLIAALGCAPAALAQKSGGTLRITHRDSPASMSVHEEGTVSVIMPMMGVFNNLVIYDQNKPQNSDATIVPELATSWSWNADHTALTSNCATASNGMTASVHCRRRQCTFDLLINKGKEKLRLNYRGELVVNLDETTVASPTSHLRTKKPQPALLALLASGDTRSIPATYRRRRCGRTRSAPGRSSSANTNPTRASRSSRTRTTEAGAAVS